MKNLALSLALTAVCGSLPALAENDERRFPDDQLSKRWVKYEQNTGGNPSRIVGGNSTVRCHADFFSYASFCNTLDGDWQSKVQSGAALLGKCLTFYTHFTSESTPERSFSVLLYQTPESSNQEKEYTLKLLLPEQPDKETENAFISMKRFVENLRHNAYNPFYTADFRVMTGRYYHVTVNKCGWLVKDYMTLY